MIIGAASHSATSHDLRARAVGRPRSCPYRCARGRDRFNEARRGGLSSVKIVDVDKEQRARAVDRLKTLGGLRAAEAQGLIDAALAGAVDQALELVNGSNAVPTSMTTSKADQLRFICDRAGRMLSQREVEILFRVTATAARSILTTMLATYEESLREKFLDRMRSDAKVLASGTDETALSWTLRFSESSTFDAAWTELSRLGLVGECDVNTARRTITLPRSLSIEGKATESLGLLGLKQPD